jgi:Flp pilus assembly protein TadB
MTTHELLFQAKASDRWAQYQAKSIRRFSAEATKDSLSSAKSDQALIDKYAQAVNHYKKDEQEIQTIAEDFEKESEAAGRKALRLHFGEVFLEIAIVFSSLAILTKRHFVYWAAVICAATGVVLACLEYLVV